MKYLKLSKKKRGLVISQVWRFKGMSGISLGKDLMVSGTAVVAEYMTWGDHMMRQGAREQSQSQARFCESELSFPSQSTAPTTSTRSQPFEATSPDITTL